MSLRKRVTIDARAAGYPGDAVRVLAITDVSNGKVLIKKTDDWKEPSKLIEDRILVTDTPAAFGHWDIQFIEEADIRAVLKHFDVAMRQNLVTIDESLRRYTPKNVLQMRKMDERGQVMEFDSSNVNNGHMAVMFAVWAAQKAYGGYTMLDVPATKEAAKQEESNADDSMLPFSI